MIIKKWDQFENLKYGQKTNQKLNIDLEKLTDNELKTFFNVENIEDLSDEGTIGEVKRYILSGKKDFTMGEKINDIEKETMLIIVERWLKSA